MPARSNNLVWDMLLCAGTGGGTNVSASVTACSGEIILKVVSTESESPASVRKHAGGGAAKNTGVTLGCKN